MVSLKNIGFDISLFRWSQTHRIFGSLYILWIRTIVLLLTLLHCCFGFANSVLKVIGASLNHMGTRHNLWITEKNLLAKQKLRSV